MGKEILTQQEQDMLISSIDVTINQISATVLQSKPEERVQLQNARNRMMALQIKVQKLETQKEKKNDKDK